MIHPNERIQNFIFFEKSNQALPDKWLPSLLDAGHDLSRMPGREGDILD
jgi:hypothetical protein